MFLLRKCSYDPCGPNTLSAWQYGNVAILGRFKRASSNVLLHCRGPWSWASFPINQIKVRRWAASRPLIRQTYQGSNPERGCIVASSIITACTFAQPLVLLQFQLLRWNPQLSNYLDLLQCLAWVFRQQRERVLQTLHGLWNRCTGCSSRCRTVDAHFLIFFPVAFSAQLLGYSHPHLISLYISSR